MAFFVLPERAVGPAFVARAGGAFATGSLPAFTGAVLAGALARTGTSRFAVAAVRAGTAFAAGLAAVRVPRVGFVALVAELPFAVIPAPSAPPRAPDRASPAPSPAFASRAQAACS